MSKSSRTKKEDAILDSVLEITFDAGEKVPVGNVGVGSLIIVKFEEPLDPDEYVIGVIFRQNKKTTRFTIPPMEGMFRWELAERVIPNTEEVVVLKPATATKE